MKVISVINRKGGVGKTTTCDAIASGLTFKGCKVLVLDLDSQANLSVACGFSEREDKSIYDVLRGKVRLSACIRETDRGSFVPGSFDMATLSKTFKVTALRDILKPYLDDYDFIIIDTPPGESVITQLALAASDTCIVPAASDLYSLRGILQLNALITFIRDNYNAALSVAGILLVRHNPRARISASMSKQIQDVALGMGTKVFESYIRECVAVREACLMQQGIFKYAPRSNAASDYAGFLLELIFGGRK